MEATEAAELIQELREDRAEEAADERFRSRAALVISVLAVLLAIATLGGGNVSEEMVNANIHASDTWAFYQAKNMRQTSNRLAADALESELLLAGGAVSPDARRRIEERIDGYRATAARYDDEPDPAAPTDTLRGEGKKQLAAIARDWERRRERAQEQDANFDYSGVLFQIAIVLGSVAILATSRPVLGLALGMGGLATLLMINGFLLLVPLPG